MEDIDPTQDKLKFAYEDCNMNIQLQPKAFNPLTLEIHKRSLTNTVWRFETEKGEGPYKYNSYDKDSINRGLDKLRESISLEDAELIKKNEKVMRYGCETFCQLMAWNYPFVANLIQKGVIRIVKVEAKKVWRTGDWPQVVFIPPTPITTKPEISKT